MRSVLVVSPHFPPVNAPDHQRVRMAVSFFEEFGWRVTLLAVSPECVEGAVIDQRLEKSLPVGTRVIRTKAMSYNATRRFGMGNLGIRAYPYIQRAGSELLSRERYDLTLFSTTQFPVMAMGRRWKRQFGTPYVLDFQDPWRNDYYERTGVRPPGGKIKYAFARLQARILEPYAVRGAAHIICVSPAYVAMLKARYPSLRRGPASDRFTVLPFGAAESDFEFLDGAGIKQSAFNRIDGKLHWVYVGAFVPAMNLALRTFFAALIQQFKSQPELRRSLKLHFIGTSYAPKERAMKTVEPLAGEFGLTDIVEEISDRQPYFDALQCLSDADALIAFGSDDPGYTASKIYPNILAKKPLLAIFHEQSSVVEVLNKTKAGTVVSFKTGESHESIAARIKSSGWLDQWNKNGGQKTEVGGQKPLVEAPATDWEAFAPYTAREMTRKLCAVFDQVVENRGAGS